MKNGKRTNKRKKKKRTRIANAGGPWLRLAEAAKRALYSDETLRRAIAKGCLKAYAPGGREIRIHVDDLDSWLRSKAATAARAAA